MRSRLFPALALSLLLAAPGVHAQAAGDDDGDDQDVPAPLSDAEVTDAFARMDSDRDGQLSLEEFLAGLARPFGSQREGVVYQKLPARFRVLDADGDGLLQANEYAGLASRWQGSGVAPSFEQADTNKDGRVDFREFAAEHAPHDDDATTAEATAAAAPTDDSTTPSTPR
jgi:hypothetical protein